MESPEAAARREVLEELRMTCTEFVALGTPFVVLRSVKMIYLVY